VSNLVIRPASPKFKILYKRARYKALYGGRSSGKSWAVVEALLYYAGTYDNMRILCAREIQKSIRESSYRLILDTIDRLKLTNDYDFTRDEITHKKTGSRFTFAGLKNNPTQIKSMEGVDICWIEECQTISRESIDILVPTIRKAGSELWFTWNPFLPSDPISSMFQSGHLPKNTLIEEVNYYDNPYLTDTIQNEIDEDKRLYPLKYEHIWLGGYIGTADDMLISLQSVSSCMNRKVLTLDVPTIAALDVARFGSDNSAIVARKGNVVTDVAKWGGLDTNQLHDKVVSWVLQRDIDTLVVDGTGVGGGVFDMLKKSLGGIKCVEFNGANKPKSNKFLNARAEVWNIMARWIKEDGSMPFDAELRDQLTTIHYLINNKQQMQLESKRDMRAKGIKSPDLGDALAMTFYQPVVNTTKSKNMIHNLYSDLGL